MGIACELETYKVRKSHIKQTQISGETTRNSNREEEGRMFNKAFSRFPILKTERLTLREIEEKDLEQVYGIFSSAEVAEFSSHYPTESKEQVFKAIHRWKSEYTEKYQLRWGIARREDDILIGTCCLGDFDENAKRSEIGYHLAFDQWNKGYMTEALKAMISFGFEDSEINRIEAFVTPGNEASTKVLEKLGFIREGLLRERDYFKEKYQDGIVFGMLRKDYRSLR